MRNITIVSFKKTHQSIWMEYYGKKRSKKLIESEFNAKVKFDKVQISFKVLFMNGRIVELDTQTIKDQKKYDGLTLNDSELKKLMAAFRSDLGSDAITIG